MLTRFVIRKARLSVMFAVCFWAYSLSAHAVEDGIIPTAIVLDIELLGDTSVVSMQAGDAKLVEMFSERLRQQLNQLTVINVLADSETLARVNQAAETQFLQRCNGCELQLAKELGAKLVVIPWVFRMSKLIQTMYLEIRDAETGSVLVYEGRNFRGNTEQGWQHVIDKLVDATEQKLNQP